jgi:hypothetical protein
MNNIDIQLIIVIAIGIVTLFFILRSMYRFFFTKRSTSYCDSCKMCKPIKYNVKKEEGNDIHKSIVNRY